MTRVTLTVELTAQGTPDHLREIARVMQSRGVTPARTSVSADLMALADAIDAAHADAAAGGHTITLHSAESRSGRYAFHATCSCSWTGPERDTRTGAESTADEHLTAAYAALVR